MINDKNIIISKDWSLINSYELPYDDNLFFYRDVNNTDSQNLGIYIDEKNRYHTSGYSGICVLKDKNNNDYIDRNGKKIILIVKPRFNVCAWTMFTEVIKDDEYESYINGTVHKLYEIMDEDKPIITNMNDSGGEVLLAISFIRSCYKICSGMLNRNMSYISENLNGKIRGRIDFSKHIKKNIAYGREDRIYCKYPSFSENTIENKILKKALEMSERLLQVNHYLDVEGLSKIREMLVYSKKRMSNIQSKIIKKSDFLSVNITGFNSTYSHAIKLAEMIINHAGITINQTGEQTGLIIPYAIKLESIFEFYARAKIKKYIKESGIKDIRLDAYRNIFSSEILLNTTNNDDCYLIHNYIPDIAFQKYNPQTNEWNYIAVMEVKYQRSTSDVINTTRRHNTHQLLFYTLLLNVKRCGFIFPSEKNKNYEDIVEELIIHPGNAKGSKREYSEFHLGDTYDEQNDEIKKIIEFVRKL